MSAIIKVYSNHANHHIHNKLNQSQLTNRHLISVRFMNNKFMLPLHSVISTSAHRRYHPIDGESPWHLYIFIFSIRNGMSLWLNNIGHFLVCFYYMRSFPMLAPFIFNYSGHNHWYYIIMTRVVPKF